MKNIIFKQKRSIITLYIKINKIGNTLKGWVKLNLFYIGKSKKHQIFRVKQWNRNLEKIYHKPVFNKNYEEIGYIKEIFGPTKIPFISIKTLPNIELNPVNELYVKV